MINHVVLVGRVVTDPELRYTATGVAVVNFVIAVNRRYKNEEGEREADFIPCVAWRGLAETIAEYVKKRTEIGLQGSLRQNRWETEDGESRSRLEVLVNHFMFTHGTKRVEEVKAKTKAKTGKAFDDDPFAGDGKPLDISEDDLPF